MGGILSLVSGIASGLSAAKLVILAVIGALLVAGALGLWWYVHSLRSDLREAQQALGKMEVVHQMDREAIGVLQAGIGRWEQEGRRYEAKIKEMVAADRAAEEEARDLPPLPQDPPALEAAARAGTARAMRVLQCASGGGCAAD